MLLSKEYGSHDGLAPDVHYAAGCDALDEARLDPRLIGREARKWYEPHRIDAHVSALRTLVTEVQK